MGKLPIIIRRGNRENGSYEVTSSLEWAPGTACFCATRIGSACTSSAIAGCADASSTDADIASERQDSRHNHRLSEYRDPSECSCNEEHDRNTHPNKKHHKLCNKHRDSVNCSEPFHDESRPSIAIRKIFNLIFNFQFIDDVREKNKCRTDLSYCTKKRIVSENKRISNSQTITNFDSNFESSEFVGNSKRLELDDRFTEVQRAESCVESFVPSSLPFFKKYRERSTITNTTTVTPNNTTTTVTIGAHTASFRKHITPSVSVTNSESSSSWTCRNCPEFRSSFSNVGIVTCHVPRLLLLLLFVTSMLFHPALGVPTPSQDEIQMDPFDGGFDGYEDPFEEDDLSITRNRLEENELEIIRRSIVQALGLQRIPDPAKANVSQAEYERAHREYLNKVQLSHQESRKRRKLHIFHAAEHPGNRSGRVYVDSVGKERGVHRQSLFFPVEIPDEDADTVDHATLRLLLEGHHRGDKVELLVHQTDDGSRGPVIRHIVHSEDPRDSRWIEVDTTEIISSLLDEGQPHLTLELEFLHSGVSTPRTFSSAVLNVFTSSEGGGRRKRAAPDQLMSLHKGRRTECRGDNKKCCRHEMTVIFKDLKGFEFIVQPKTFDAGYCKGRCPPRYNPAHHHALLQSLIWKEDRRKAPRPCCAPSKLAELEILYFDENDSTRLKVSNWKNMRVLECACS